MGLKKNTLDKYITTVRTKARLNYTLLATRRLRSGDYAYPLITTPESAHNYYMEVEGIGGEVLAWRR